MDSARAARRGGHHGQCLLRGAGGRTLVALGRQKRFGSLLVDTLEPKPYISNERVLDATVPPGWRYYWKSLYVHEQSDEAIDALVAHA